MPSSSFKPFIQIKLVQLSGIMFPLVYPRVSPVPLLIPILSPFSAISFLVPSRIGGLIPCLSPISPVGPAGPQRAVWWTAGSEAGRVGSRWQGAAYGAAGAGPLSAIPAARGKGSCNWLTHCCLPTLVHWKLMGTALGTANLRPQAFHRHALHSCKQWTGEKAVS